MARVAVDVPLPHLDRPFDYLVPERLQDQARPGVRVRVAFAGRDVDAFVLERVAVSEHAGRLAAVRRVVSPEPVLTPAVLALARAVADRYAGVLADVLRLAVPPRHAATEKALAGPIAPGAAAQAQPAASAGASGSAWSGYPAAPALLARLRSGEAPRAVWTAPPGRLWPHAVAEAVGATLAGGRGALVVVPDRRDLDTLQPALVQRLGEGSHTRLEADLGPAARYAAFLSALRGHTRVVIGTRAAAFAPVRNLGLVVVWDDADDVLAEPRAPYPHVREVAALRSDLEGAGLLVGGWSRTAETARWLARGYAREVVADRAVRRTPWPRVLVGGGLGPRERDPLAAAARIPHDAWTALREGLGRGSVLVQVPRAGYLPGMTCGTCRRPARCPFCAGPVQLPAVAEPDGARAPHCGWCARPLPGWTCPHCSGRRLRARTVGVERTAEELGRAFPGARVVVSRASRTLPRVPDRGALVLATPGVEPGVEGGYAAAVLLDGDAMLDRPDLRAAEETLARWSAVAASVRPAHDGGLLVVCADPSAPAVQALVRLDPAWHAARELAERAELALPPAAALASVTGRPSAVTGFADRVQAAWPSGRPRPEQLGPVPVEEPPEPAGRTTPISRVSPVPSVPPVLPAGEEPPVRLLLRVGEGQAGELARALRSAAAAGSARREPVVRVQVDPRRL